MEYRVTWTIDVEADSPQAAARRANELMPCVSVICPCNDNPATVFTVAELDDSQSFHLGKPMDINVADLE